MTKPKLWVGVALFLAIASFTFAADSSQVVSPDCARSGANSRIVARLVEPAAVASARVYFHADGKPGDYYLDMRKSPSGESWALLPRTAAATQTVVYKVVTIDAQGRSVTSPEKRVPVTSSCALPTLSPEETSYAANLVVGQTLDEQATVPPGFMCDGIVSLISAKGEMRTSLACREPGDVQIGGGSTLRGSGAGASGGLVVHDSNGGTAKPLSSSRPAGASPKP